MTNEERARRIKWIFSFLLVVGIVAAVYFDPEGNDALQPVVIPDEGLQIVLYEQPGDPPSDELGVILDRIGKKYDKLVIITHVDVAKHSVLAKAAGVEKPPHVFMIAKSGPVFNFQGLWPREKVELKVDEILRGLKRFNKDWRPPVPGMKKS